MMSQILSHTNLTVFARISLVLFLVIYAVVLFIALNPLNKAKFKNISENILKED
ncbi:MAG: cbb3-type cytochrome c oxidase subunit 3 [Oligoflexia bacterium]|nr:cbb3-type cytochrome c oxidase subunit 3 [Oligoflexia bacterium]